MRNRRYSIDLQAVEIEEKNEEYKLPEGNRNQVSQLIVYNDVTAEF